MSRMSDLHIGITEMVQRGFSYESIIDSMVAEGLPRDACRTIIDVIADQIDAQERADEIAAEAYYHGA
jgi:hypothetical protein